MNKIKCLLVGSAMLVAGVAFADNVVTPFDRLKLAEEKPFSATASSGLVNATIAPENPKVVNDYYVLEGELSNTTAALAMKASDDVGKTDIEKFTVAFRAGFVDASELKAYEGAKIGFVLTSGTAAQYFDGTVWVAFDTFTEIAEDAEVTLTVDFDGRQNLARFTLGEEVLKVAGSEWVPVCAIAANTIKAFGAGEIKALAGQTMSISGIVIPAPAGKKAIEVAINEDEVQAIEAAGGFDKQSEQVSGMNNIEAFILTGKAGDEAVKPVAKIETTSEDGGKINFKLDGVEVQEIENGTVAFILEGSNDNSAWIEIQRGSSATIAMPIANAGTYKFFRVRAVVEANATEAK